MRFPLRHCAFLTIEDLSGYVADDQLSQEPLRALGWEVESIPWRRHGVTWEAYDAVVIRSTWDYWKDSDHFLAVLAEINRSGTMLCNSLDLVRWNIRKTYLRDLARRGVAVVPTVWRDRLGPGDLTGVIDEVAAAELVIKPVISASAHGAFRVARRMAPYDVAIVEAYYAYRALMAQPLVRAIVEEGEYSLFYFNGEYSHAIRKSPKPGDFRVQEEHGGHIEPVTVDVPLRATADAAIHAIEEAPLYARVDLVRSNDDSGFWLMELELIEPSLYLRTDANAPARFARALQQHARAEQAAPRAGDT